MAEYSFRRELRDRPEGSQPRDGLAMFACQLYDMAVECSRRRSQVESRWYRALRQILGEYDAETRDALESRAGASRLFVNQTRPKCGVMRDRLTEILFPKGEANWDVQPTPIPEIAEMAAQPPVDGEGTPGAEDRMAEAQAAQEIADEVRRRTDEMRRVMSDQLAETDYAGEGMQCIEDMVRLGTGVMKGPVAFGNRLKRWNRDGGGRWKVEHVDDPRPAFERVDPWDFYPDMDAMSVQEAEYTFQLHVMGRSQLREKALTGEFDRAETRELLLADPDYSPLDVSFAADRRDLRADDDAGYRAEESRYHVFEYHGPVPYDTLREIAERTERGELLDEAMRGEDPLKVSEAVIWFAQDRILKFALKPTRGTLYSVVRMERSEGSMFGIGVPEMMQDPQSALNAVFRMMMDNAALSGMPVMILDRDALEPANDPTDFSILPGKVFFKVGQTEGAPIEPVAVEGSIEQLKFLMELSLRFCDDETRLPLITQGEAGTFARQTAHGMSLLVNAVNIVFKAAAVRFDREFTLPNVRRLYDWNMEFNDDPAIKGDMEVRALGSSVLLVRETQAQNMLMILNMALSNPEAAARVRVTEMLRSLMQTIQLDDASLIVSDEELEAMRQQPPPPDPNVELKLQIEQVRGDYMVQVENMRLQAALAKIAAASDQSVQQVAKDLKLGELDIAAKERLFAAEVAVKERHGEGI